MINLKVEHHRNTNEICFTISDTGMGISNDGIKNLFAPFEREERSERFVEGTGLGLSIVKKILDLMGGSITCTSKVDVGTTFKVRIPTKTISRVNADEGKENLTIDISSGSRKPSILVVDDNETNLWLAEAIMKKLDVEYSLAPDGYRAIEMIKSEEYDLVLMDIKMPGIDGYETVERIRKLTIKQPTIYALTAQAF